MNCAPLHRHAVQTAAMAFSSPGAPSTMRNSGRRRPRLIRSSSTVRQASVLSPPMLLIASSTFSLLPARRAPEQRDRGPFPVQPTRTTAPSNEPTIGSSVSERVFQASQSVFTLRDTRLTVSLPTAPPNSAASARRTRRVLVRRGRSRQSRRRRPVCGVDRRATPNCATP